MNKSAISAALMHLANQIAKISSQKELHSLTVVKLERILTELEEIAEGLMLEVLDEQEKANF